MLAALRAEFRKLLTVRSTYIIFAFVILLVLFFAGWIEGYKANKEMLGSPAHLATEIRSAINFCAIFGGLIAILLFSHEYRYNTIMHTLTSVNRRSKVLLAKIIVMSAFALILGAVVGVLSPLASLAGMHLAGHELVAQTIPYSELVWRGLFYTWGYAMAGLVLVALSRNQVFAIVAIFFIPVTIEAIASLLLKDNSIYLAFNALNNVIMDNPKMTPDKAALVYSAHLASWWLIGWLLFLRRDATNNRS